MLLLVGPVLIMVVFGLSLDVQSILQPRALVVVEPGSEGAELFEKYRYEFTNRTTFAGTTDDPEATRQQLLRGEVDAVISIPSDPSETISEGEQAVLDVTYNSINPVFGTAVPRRVYGLVLDLNQSLVEEAIARNIGDVRSARQQIDYLNRQLDNVDLAAETLASEEGQAATAELDDSLSELEESLEILQDTPGETGEDAQAALEQVRQVREQLAEVREAQEGGAEEVEELTGVSELEQTVEDLQNTFAEAPDAPPEVLANPFRAEVRNLAAAPGIVGFYAPGVLALLIQHIAVSMACLSIIRERQRGAYEFFEVSPLGTGELLAGKFLTYFGLVLAATLAVAVVLAVFLGIPVGGGVLMMALAMALVTLASLGLGFLVSALARSQLQAVQVAMLLLIASVLFAGFLFPLGDMQGPARWIAYLLPAAYGIRSLQDVMIRGQEIPLFDLAGPLVIAAVSLILTLYLMRRKKT
ncbi:MAG: ABC transporter permease [Actinomycetota bacterium]|nr:ABC transporter permease [Actinomycetota bacterium]